MKKGLILYYIGVFVFFTVLIFSVRYVVNTTRMFVSFETGFNPVLIKWDIDKSDSTLRIKEPIFLRKDYQLIKYDDNSFIQNDSVLFADLESDSIPNKGNLLNIQPPYYIWKEANNDTLKVFKHGVTLKFTSNLK